MADRLPSPGNAAAPDDWLKVRRSYIRDLRRQTKAIILLLACMEALKHGPLQLVYAGKHGYSEPGPEDFGITYTVAYILSYIYICIFMIVFIPFFSWWLPTSSPTCDNCDPTKPSLISRISTYLHKFNMIWLPFCVAFSATFYVTYLVEALIFVDERRSNTSWRKAIFSSSKKVWKLRALLVMSIAASLGLGYGALQVLRMVELAHIKPLEYALIVVPVQINIGMLFGTRMQWKMERRAAMKMAAMEREVERAELNAVVVDEKAP